MAKQNPKTREVLLFFCSKNKIETDLKDSLKISYCSVYKPVLAQSIFYN